MGRYTLPDEKFLVAVTRSSRWDDLYSRNMQILRDSQTRNDDDFCESLNEVNRRREASRHFAVSEVYMPYATDRVASTRAVLRDDLL